MLFKKIMLVALIAFARSKSTAAEENIVQKLLKRYNDQSKECVDENQVPRPAYECSGIITRGVVNQTKYAWSLAEPAEIEGNSFKAAFLRSDHQYSVMRWRKYDSGFIIYPHLLTPKQKNVQDVLCAFPLVTKNGRDQRGCGQYKSDEIGVSRPCKDQNIITYQDWLVHYNQIMASDNPLFNINQCSFDMTSQETAARNYAVVLEAKAHLQQSPKYPFRSSELRFAAFNEDNTKQIPIEAFFYFIDTERGYQNALKYQNDFLTQTGEKLPIVGIRLPSASNPNIHIEEVF